MSRHDSRAIAAHARKGFLAKWERQVDPDGTLDPEDRSRRARAAMRAHMARLGRKGGRSPRK